MSWLSPLAYCEISIGAHKFRCGIDRKSDDLGQTEGVGYRVMINHQETDIEASSDHEAVKVGMVRIGEMLSDRLSKFEGNPYALPVVEVDDSDEQGEQ